jgi:hypothetical protein
VHDVEPWEKIIDLSNLHDATVQGGHAAAAGSSKTTRLLRR